MAMSEISESGRKRNSERTVRSDGEGAAAGASRRTGGTLALHFLYGRAARWKKTLEGASGAAPRPADSPFSQFGTDWFAPGVKF